MIYCFSLNDAFKRYRITVGTFIVIFFPLLVLSLGGGGYLFSFISLDIGIVVGLMLKGKERVMDVIEALICAIFVEVLLEMVFHFNTPLYNWSPTGSYRVTFFFPDPDLFAIFTGVLPLLMLSHVREWGMRDYISIMLSELIIIMTKTIGIIAISLIILLLVSLKRKEEGLLWVASSLLGISLIVGYEKIWYIVKYFSTVSSLRLHKWKIALSAFNDSPFLGIGFGKLPFWFYIQTGSLGLADSGLIDLLSQGGIIAFSAFIAGLTLVTKRKTLIMFTYIILTSMFYTTFLNPILTFMFGFALMFTMKKTKLSS